MPDNCKEPPKTRAFENEADSARDFVMGKRIVVTVIWVFITVVTAADMCVTWEFRSSMLEWEANPIAVLLFRWSGPIGVLLYRAAWVAYARIMSRTHSRLSRLVTPLWGVAHLYLLMTLIQAYPALAVLQRACEAQATAETVASGRDAAQKALESMHQCCASVKLHSTLRARNLSRASRPSLVDGSMTRHVELPLRMREGRPRARCLVGVRCSKGSTKCCRCIA
jgi:hypothetical protein